MVMKTNILIPFIALASFFSIGFTSEVFKERTLTSWEFSIRSSKLFPKSTQGHAIDRALTGLTSEVEFTGRSRKLGSEKQELLRKIENVGTIYSQEIEVRDGGFAYWVAVQDKVFPHLGKELKTGENFKMYYHFAGVAKKQQPVYLMVEFDSAVAKN